MRRLKGLTEIDYTIARLVDEENLSYTLIGESLGLNRNQVAGKVYRLRIRGLIDTPAESWRKTVRAKKRKGRTIKIHGVVRSNYAVKKPNNTSQATKEDMFNRMIRAKETVALESTGAGSVDIEDLKEMHCRWLFDDGSYCGDKITVNSYCPKHASICYQSVA